MTVLVGVRCTDGVVVGADSSATFGAHPQAKTIEQRVQKVFVVADKIIVAGTGAVGLGQRFTAAIETAYSGKEFAGEGSPIEFGKKLCMAGLRDFQPTGVQPGRFAAMVAFPIKNAAFLCELGLVDFQPELKTDDMWFCSMGSGQPITDPFLAFVKRVFFPNAQPSLKEGLFMVTWALMHAIELNPGGINGPPQIAVLERGKDSASARLLHDEELDEHKGSVEAAEEYLRGYRKLLSGEGSSPAIPQPMNSTSSKT